MMMTTSQQQLDHHRLSPRSIGPYESNNLHHDMVDDAFPHRMVQDIMDTSFLD